MQFTETPLEGVYTILPHSHEDQRGFFRRFFYADEFERVGIENTFTQMNLSTNPKSFTLRGLHYQEKPYEEAKIIFCIRGKIFDVVLDLRPDSPTYAHHYCIELEPYNQGIFLPKGCAHGFMTLQDDSEVLYLASSTYVPSFSKGILWNDPYFNISWPATPKVISERDLSHPLYKEVVV